MSWSVSDTLFFFVGGGGGEGIQVSPCADETRFLVACGDGRVLVFNTADAAVVSNSLILKSNLC